MAVTALGFGPAPIDRVSGFNGAVTHVCRATAQGRANCALTPKLQWRYAACFGISQAVMVQTRMKQAALLNPCFVSVI